MPGGRKDHDEPVPYGGGLAIFAAVAIPATGGLALALAGGELGFLPHDVLQHFPGVIVQSRQVFAILVGAAMMLFVGYIDDRLGLSVAVKLAAQVAAAVTLVLADVVVTAHLPWPAAHVAATILFVVFATNAANFIDNMNGLLVGVAAIEASCFLAIAVGSGQLFVAAILICLIGGLLAFLPRNFPKAQLFLGDAGSLTIGFLIAAMTIVCKFDIGTMSTRPVVMPLLILFVPLLDGLARHGHAPPRGAQPVRGRPGPPVAPPDAVRLHARSRGDVPLGPQPLRGRPRARVRAASRSPSSLFTVAPTVFCLAWVARRVQ